MTTEKTTKKYPTFLFLDTLFFVLVVTSSFDLILNFKFHGLTVRFAHFVALAFIMMVISKSKNKILLLKNSLIYSILTYLTVAGISIYNSHFLLKSLGYFSWGIFDFIMLLALMVYVVKHENVERILNIYLVAYLFVCLFGLFQFFVSPVLVTQWINSVPRINSFFYEPSFFAFFAVQGLCIAGTVLFLKKDFSVFYFVNFILMGFTVFLSTSKSGWIAMTMFLLIIGFLSFKKKKFYRYSLTVMFLTSMIVLNLVVLSSKIDLRLLTGEIIQQANIENGSSGAPRLKSIQQALRIFEYGESPLIGVGIGGYGGYVMAHPEFKTVSDEKNNAYTVTTTNLWVEALAETGILGFSALLTMIMVFLLNAFIMARYNPEIREYLTGIIIAVFVTFFISYQFCQTLFRLDTWILLGMGIGLMRKNKGDCLL